MQNIANFIAAHRSHDGERKSSGAFMAGLFVAVMLLGSAGAAMWIGSFLAQSSAQAAPMEVSSYGYE